MAISSSTFRKARELVGHVPPSQQDALAKAFAKNYYFDRRAGDEFIFLIECHDGKLESVWYAWQLSVYFTHDGGVVISCYPVANRPERGAWDIVSEDTISAEARRDYEGEATTLLAEVRDLVARHAPKVKAA